MILHSTFGLKFGFFVNLSQGFRNSLKAGHSYYKDCMLQTLKIDCGYWQ